MFADIYRYPDSLVLYKDNGTILHLSGAVKDNGIIIYETEDVKVEFKRESDRAEVILTAVSTPVRGIRLRWNQTVRDTVTILGDHWERGYGDLEWRGIVPERVMPWYILMSTDCELAAYGVKVCPNAFCSWQVDTEGVTLYLDVRCGGDGVILSGNTITAAQLVQDSYDVSAKSIPVSQHPEGESKEAEDITFSHGMKEHASDQLQVKGYLVYEAARAFCRKMCTAALPLNKPVYGFNNWYYAYGRSSQEEIMECSRYLAKLTAGLENRPFMVIDDGWQMRHLSSSDYNGGPWNRGNERFPDMAGLAKMMKQAGVSPGIWVRLLQDGSKDIPESWRLSGSLDCLDPSVPEVLKRVAVDVRRLNRWGYQLIKHDFSTFDMFDCWGNQMNGRQSGGPALYGTVTRDGWHFADRSKTSAQIVKQLYETILTAAGDSIILGCNCIGHLGAGFMHLNRTGDDTSGVDWERTRRMGINTLAFRMPQHGIFFEADADCAGLTDRIEWNYNRQWLTLLAGSGTPLFVSVKPGTLSPEQEAEVAKACCIASSRRENAVPLDWMETTCPSLWKHDTHAVSYHWFE